MKYGNEIIADELTKLGLDARLIDGWVYLALPRNRMLWIGAEYGASLEADIYDHQPYWFAKSPKHSVKETA